MRKSDLRSISIRIDLQLSLRLSFYCRFFVRNWVPLNIPFNRGSTSAGLFVTFCWDRLIRALVKSLDDSQRRLTLIKEHLLHFFRGLSIRSCSFSRKLVVLFRETYLRCTVDNGVVFCMFQHDHALTQIK